MFQLIKFSDFTNFERKFILKYELSKLHLYIFFEKYERFRISYDNVSQSRFVSLFNSFFQNSMSSLSNWFFQLQNILDNQRNSRSNNSYYFSKTFQKFINLLIFERVFFVSAHLLIIFVNLMKIQISQSKLTWDFEQKSRIYINFSITSKKEMLLQNLEKMIKIFEVQDNFFISTRIVLYDSVIRQIDNEFRDSNQQNMKQLEIDKKNLKTRYDFKALRNSKSFFDETANFNNDSLSWKNRSFRFMQSFIHSNSCDHSFSLRDLFN